MSSRVTLLSIARSLNERQAAAGRAAQNAMAGTDRETWQQLASDCRTMADELNAALFTMQKGY